jgi:hypothetical protein
MISQQRFCRVLVIGVAVLALGGCGRKPQPAAAPVPAPMSTPAVPAGCALFVGGSSGNDPSMQAKLALCPTPTGFGGWMRFVSETSGWSLREVAGAVEPNGTLVLRDTRFLERHPSDDWQLCPVEWYALREVRPGELEGHYLSTPCADRASIFLRRVQ